MKSGLHDIVDRFEGRRILVLGDVMLDEYIWGDVQRVSPEAPVPVVDMQRRSCVAGGAGNTATNAAALGGTVLLGGVIGQDVEGERLAEVLRGAAVDIRGLVSDTKRPTTAKTRIIAHSQQVVRLDRERREPLPRALEDQLLEWTKAEMSLADVCILSDYAKGVVSRQFSERVIGMARSAAKPVIVDPKGNDYEKYRGATLIKPNASEVERVLHRELRDETAWLEAGRQLTIDLPGTALLVSRGPLGMTLFQADAPPVHIAAVAQGVFDVTGAGDTVVATVALALAAGAELEQAAHLANRAAGIVVGKVGTAAVTALELLAQLDSRPKRSGGNTLSPAGVLIQSQRGGPIQGDRS